MDTAMDATSGVGGDPSSWAGTSNRQPPTLTDLLQQSRKLNTQLGARGADLPSIHLGLDQIEAQSRKIAQARATTQAGVAGAGFGGGGGGGFGSSGSGRDSLATDGTSGFAHGMGNDTKAHYFLANGGIDASGLADTINQTNIAQAFEPLQPIYDTDVDVSV